MTKITKRINIVVLAGLVATSAAFTVPSVSAQSFDGADRGGRGGHQGGPRGGGQGGDRLAKAFEHLDENSDGVLVLSELTANIDARAEKLLEKKDADENGSLSLAEFSTNRRGEVRDLSGIAEEIVQCVTDLKAESGDENIQVPSVDDFQSPEQHFNALDTSVDGALDLAELQAGGLNKATAKFNHMDADEDGQVSQEEFAAAHLVKQASKKAIRECVHQINDEEGIL